MQLRQDSGSGQARARMVAVPASVPAARRLVDDLLLRWGRADLVDDVGLCATELATNATLHGAVDGGAFDIELSRSGAVVRLAVTDRGGTPAQLIATRSDLTLPPPGELDEESMTGRGLFIVAVLSRRWGIEDVAEGTRVWAEFDGAPGEYVVQEPEVAIGRPTMAAAETHRVVRLEGCPAGLLLQHEEHLADIARELQLVGVGHPDPQALSLARTITGVLARSSLTWEPALLFAREALRAGRETVDVIVLAPPDAVGEVCRLGRAVRAAETMAAAGSLFSEPATAPVQRLRAWMFQEVLGQVRTGRAAVPFDAGADPA